MKDKKWYKLLPYGVAAMAVLLSVLFLRIIFPTYFELNDDSTIQSIVSGAYSGNYDGHAVYMSYPMTTILNLLYRLIPYVSWYGVLLHACFAFGLFIILSSLLTKASKPENYAYIVIPTCLVYWAICADSFIVVHYTVAAVVLGSAALFRFCMKESKGGIVDTLKDSAVSVVVLWIVFIIRTQSFYLLLPFALCVILWKCFREKFTAKVLAKYACVIGITLLGVGILWGIGQIAYLSPSWQEYLRYNDARTQVYDYTGIPDYTEENGDFYDSIGIDSASVNLMEEYNTQLLRNVDDTQLNQIADEAKIQNHVQKTPVRFIKDIFKTYYYQMRYSSRYGFICMALGLAYLLCIGLMIIKKEKKQTIFPILLLAIRSLVWMYLLYRGRFPERIEISLYIAEFTFIGAMIYNTMERSENKRKWVTSAVVGCYMGILVLLFAGQILMVRGDLAYKGGNHADTKALTSYFASNSDNVYCVDVFSFVLQTESVYEAKNYHTFENYVPLGGWLTNSPLYEDKMAKLGVASAYEGMRNEENWYLCILSSRSTDGIMQYYNACGQPIAFTEADTITVPSGKQYRILKAEPVQNLEE